MKYIKLIIPFFIFLFVSCKQPLDVDTPRQIVKTDGRVKIYPNSIEMTIEENGVKRDFITTSSNIYADTMLSVPAIWFNIELTANPDAKIEHNKLFIKSLVLHFDSMLVDNTPYTINGKDLINSWTKAYLNRGEKSYFDTTVLSNPIDYISDVSFSINKEKKEIWANIYSKTYNSRLWIEKRDSIYTDSVTVMKYDTTYPGGVMKIDSSYTKQPVEVTKTIEETKRAKDSLFLTGKIKMMYK